MTDRLFRFLASTAADCEAGSVGGTNPVALGDCLKLGDNTSVSTVYTSPAFLVNLVVRNLFVFAGIIILFLIFYAGFKMISGGKKGLDEAKTITVNAVIGLVIMICAYWIVQVVGYLTGTPVGLPVR